MLVTAKHFYTTRAACSAWQLSAIHDAYLSLIVSSLREF